MTKPQWQHDIDLKKLELKDLLDSAQTYAGRGETHGLYDLYIKIGKKAGEIAELYQKNLPA